MPSCLSWFAYNLNWVCRRPAQFIKYRRFSFRGGIPSNSWWGCVDCIFLILTIDSISDQYLKRKCKEVPTKMFGSVNGLYQWLTEQSGGVFLGVVSGVWYISNSVLSIDTCLYIVFHKTQAEAEEASLLIKPELHSEIGSYRRESKFF